jgi:hypothetical protein
MKSLPHWATMWTLPAASITGMTPPQVAEPGTSAGVDQPAARGGSFGVGVGASVGSDVCPVDAEGVGAGVGAAVASGGTEGDADASGAWEASPTGPLLTAGLGESEADADGALAQPLTMIAKLAASARVVVLAEKPSLTIPPTPVFRARSAREYSSSHVRRTRAARCCAGSNRYFRPWRRDCHRPARTSAQPTREPVGAMECGASGHSGPSQSANGVVVLLPHPPPSCRLFSSCGRCEVNQKELVAKWFEI